MDMEWIAENRGGRLKLCSEAYIHRLDDLGLDHTCATYQPRLQVPLSTISCECGMVSWFVYVLVFSLHKMNSNFAATPNAALRRI